MRSECDHLDLGYRPLVYFWIAEFEDGTALPQFDPETGLENKADPDWLSSAPSQPAIPKAKVWEEKQVARIGWYPFTPELSKKIYEATKTIVVPTLNPIKAINVKKGQKIVAYRTNTIKLHTKTGGIERGETVYVLGVEGGKIMRIKEDGTVE